MPYNYLKRKYLDIRRISKYSNESLPQKFKVKDWMPPLEKLIYAALLVGAYSWLYFSHPKTLEGQAAHQPNAQTVTVDSSNVPLHPIRSIEDTLSLEKK